MSPRPHQERTFVGCVLWSPGGNPDCFDFHTAMATSCLKATFTVLHAGVFCIAQFVNTKYIMCFNVFLHFIYVYVCEYVQEWCGYLRRPKVVFYDLYMHNMECVCPHTTHIYMRPCMKQCSRHKSGWRLDWNKPCMMIHVISANGSQRQEGHQMLKASLAYRANPNLLHL